MIKTRIVAIVLIKSGIAVQSIGFQKYLPIGSPEVAISFLNRWNVDEIVVLNIDATGKDLQPFINHVKNYSALCQVPLTIGGGITQISDIKKMIQSGADKVIINSGLILQPNLIKEAADTFGSQCIVVSLDAKRHSKTYWEGFIQSGKSPTGYRIEELAELAQKQGAGEILINSIDRDGSKLGYDLELIQNIVNITTIPVIACGGVGHPKHMHEAIKLGVSAVAAGNFFHFTEHSVITTKQYLNAHSLPIRLDNRINYETFNFDRQGRINKMCDLKLDSLRFQYFPEEII